MAARLFALRYFHWSRLVIQHGRICPPRANDANLSMGPWQLKVRHARWLSVLACFMTCVTRTTCFGPQPQISTSTNPAYCNYLNITSCLSMPSCFDAGLHFALGPIFQRVLMSESEISASSRSSQARARSSRIYPRDHLILLWYCWQKATNLLIVLV